MKKTKKEKNTQALIRKEEYEKRSPQEQLDLLDEKFGVGIGAKKERAKLKALIEKKEK